MAVLRRLLRSDRGVSMVEYAIVLALIAGLCLGVISALGTSVNGAFKSVAGCGGSSGQGATRCSLGSANGAGNSGGNP